MTSGTALNVSNKLPINPTVINLNIVGMGGLEPPTSNVSD
jgi:hypothetical protein